MKRRRGVIISLSQSYYEVLLHSLKIFLLNPGLGPSWVLLLLSASNLFTDDCDYVYSKICFLFLSSFLINVSLLKWSSKSMSSLK